MQYQCISREIHIKSLYTIGANTPSGYPQVDKYCEVLVTTYPAGIMSEYFLTDKNNINLKTLQSLISIPYTLYPKYQCLPVSLCKYQNKIESCA